jgi:hypothetical protein
VHDCPLRLRVGDARLDARILDFALQRLIVCGAKQW